MKKLKLNLLIKSDLFNGLLKTYTCIEQENAGRCELDEMSGQEDWGRVERHKIKGLSDNKRISTE